jgi:hypothetical protein
MGVVKRANNRRRLDASVAEQVMRRLRAQRATEGRATTIDDMRAAEREIRRAETVIYKLKGREL